MTPKGTVWGLLAQFQSPHDVLMAVRRAREAGYRRIDAYTPYCVEGLSAELGMTRSRIPSIVLIGGLVGAGVGFFMQYHSMAVDYPLNVGGRPYNSWPVFIPITFEVMILVAACSAFLGMLFLNGLPQPHHPLFNVPEFARASQDRFFICIEATDARFNLDDTGAFLRHLAGTEGVFVVPETEPTGDELPAEATGPLVTTEETVAGTA